VLLLDLGLRDGDGAQVLRRLRRATAGRLPDAAMPVLIMTARDRVSSRIENLDMGADDYVTKPFGIDELMARVRAALRRRGTPAVEEPSSFEAGDFRVDMDARRVHTQGREVRLTPKEFDLFVYMARHPNRVLTHAALLEAVWGQASQEQPEYLRVFMGQLRKKLEPDPSNPRYLVTEPWVGYRFNPKG
jgi:two-component system KDP operon response regulator KdpE